MCASTLGVALGALLVTVLPRARFSRPGGTINGGRGFSESGSTFGPTLMSLGVPRNAGCGNFNGKGTRFWPPEPEALSSARMDGAAIKPSARATTRDCARRLNRRTLENGFFFIEWSFCASFICVLNKLGRIVTTLQIWRSSIELAFGGGHVPRHFSRGRSLVCCLILARGRSLVEAT